MNFLRTSEKLAYLKRTGKFGSYRYWYWHNKLQTIIGKPKPKDKHLLEITPTYPNHPDINPRELQVGDIVFHIPKLQFGILLKFDKIYWMIESRSEIIFRSLEKSVELVGNNLEPPKNQEIESNLLNLKTAQEINFAERLGATLVDKYIEKHILKYPYNEKILCLLHRRMFKYIYNWAGNYRQEEMVVGRHESDTLDWEKIPKKISHFFKQFNATPQKTMKNKKLLIQKLVFFHQQLAWIHPFKDGNGRIIRLMCDLIAWKWGYKLEWHLEKGKSRKHYHHAVRYAVHHQKTAQLSRIISRSLKETMHQN